MWYPDDENGDALRRMHEAGMDLLQVHNIDFWHLFLRKCDAEAMALRCREIGTSADVEENDANVEESGEVGGWDVRCVVSMVPTHEAITETEFRLGRIAEECGGKADGWGVFIE